MDYGAILGNLTAGTGPFIQRIIAGQLLLQRQSVERCKCMYDANPLPGPLHRKAASQDGTIDTSHAILMSKYRLYNLPHLP